MSSGSHNIINLTPPEIKKEAEISSLKLLPEKSRKVYTTIYKSFLEWKSAKKADSFSESVLLVYFTELSDKFKYSTLWKHYSILKTTINLYQGINIEVYSKLLAFIKSKSEGFQPKKWKTFSPENINVFLTNAPDDRYLATKVALILGVMGACRCNELSTMKTCDLQDLGSAFLINVPEPKTKITRKFTVTGEFYKICKNYLIKRPSKSLSNSKVLFLNYQNGKCTKQRIGINKFNKMGKEIALFLELPDPEQYSGHTFRRSSATILDDAGVDITTLKRHGGWKSTSVAEGNIDDSIRNINDTAKKIADSILINTTGEKSSVQNNTFDINSISNNQSNVFDINSIPGINLTNCFNVTININK